MPKVRLVEMTNWNVRPELSGKNIPKDSKVDSKQDAMPKTTTLVFGCVILSVSASIAQVELSKYADVNWYLDVQKLTCAQLAHTYQEDADFLGIWYSGWYNGLAKKHVINVPRVKENIHKVIVYCKDNQDKRVVQAIDDILKQDR